MAEVNGLTAERMLEIEAASVVDGGVVGDNLILTKFDGSEIDAGDVRGPAGTGTTTAPRVTVLPSSPTDQEEVFFAPQEGILWHLKWNAGSSLPHKWEFCGGSPIQVSETANSNPTVASTLDPNIPVLTLARPGVYEVVMHGRFDGLPAGQQNIWRLINAATTMFAEFNERNNAEWSEGSNTIRFTTTAVNEVLRSYILASTSGGRQTDRRYFVKPVRLS